MAVSGWNGRNSTTVRSRFSLDAAILVCRGSRFGRPAPSDQRAVGAHRKGRLCAHSPGLAKFLHATTRERVLDAEHATAFANDRLDVFHIATSAARVLVVRSGTAGLCTQGNRAAPWLQGGAKRCIAHGFTIGPEERRAARPLAGFVVLGETWRHRSWAPTPRALDLREIASGSMPGLTAEIGQTPDRAAAVCPGSQGHVSGARSDLGNCTLEGSPVTTQARRTWRDDHEATEYGASGVAAVLALRVRGYAVAERSRKGEGFDYRLGWGSSQPPFKGEARLDASGIRNGKASDVRNRVAEKRRQIARGA